MHHVPAVLTALDDSKGCPLADLQADIDSPPANSIVWRFLVLRGVRLLTSSAIEQCYGETPTVHIPPVFRQEDNQELIRAITHFPFATLVVQLPSPAGGASLLDAHHLPFHYCNDGNYCNDGDGPVLQAHIGKANPLWQQLPAGSEVLTVFNGPHHYISPNYYPTKREHGRAVPTWNYVAVHVRGNIRYVHDPDWLAKVVGQMTAAQESSQATPWSLSDAPAEYIERMVTGIVGVEIRITSMQGQWKLSQNQPQQNRQGVIDGLNESRDQKAQQMAHWVLSQK